MPRSCAWAPRRSCPAPGERSCFRSSRATPRCAGTRRGTRPSALPGALGFLSPIGPGTRGGGADLLGDLLGLLGIEIEGDLEAPRPRRRCAPCRASSARSGGSRRCRFPCRCPWSGSGFRGRIRYSLAACGARGGLPLSRHDRDCHASRSGDRRRRVADRTARRTLCARRRVRREFEALVAEILAAYIRDHDPSTERAFVAVEGGAGSARSSAFGRESRA
jgi:hypothetical protein